MSPHGGQRRTFRSALLDCGRSVETGGAQRGSAQRGSRAVGRAWLLASRERERTAALTWAPKTPTVNVLGAQRRNCHRKGSRPPPSASVPAGGARGRSAPARPHLGCI